MSTENQACEVPIEELLVRVPLEHRLVIEEPLSSTHIPVGRHCHKAAAAITTLRAVLDAANKEREAVLMENAQCYDVHNTDCARISKLEGALRECVVLIEQRVSREEMESTVERARAVLAKEGA